ncbi:hypothetical protein DH2020_049310 [Rehmannia glutinosa]|uniref:Uncharacterized protein n=1 Tax=Rehmannia glutinosa TaxID=99300 RepID=A0ABR0U498_REHGL
MDFFSDSDGEKAVEEVLSQAMDSTILEQVAAINCAGFTDSGLPSHLETRFQRLKSLPSSTAKPASLSTKSLSLPHRPEFKKGDSVNEAKKSDSSEGKDGEKVEKGSSKCSTKCPEEKTYLSDNGSFSPNPRGKMEKKGKKSPSFSSSCEGFSSRSISPPVKSGCFLCSPKKMSRKKNKENRGLDLGLDWGKHDELLSDLSNFSVNSQRKMIKKAMEDEERICREAEKIVKWAKHASARMDISDIEDELSGDENAKFH